MTRPNSANSAQRTVGRAARVILPYAPPPHGTAAPTIRCLPVDRGADGGPYRRRRTNFATHAALANAIAIDEGSGTAA